MERLEALRKIYVAPFRPADKKEIYTTIKDVKTHWNSFDDGVERALYLRPGIDELLLQEQLEHDSYVTRCPQSRREVKRKPPLILDDALNDDDWHAIAMYHEILAPVKKATALLHGHAGGIFGAIWQVLPTFEKLLKKFEELKASYHTLLLEYANITADYKPKETPPPPRKRPVLADDFLSDDEVSDTEQYREEQSIEQQSAEYNRGRRSALLLLAPSPIPYWLGRRERWPQLAALAMDIYATPVISDDPERVFSRTRAAFPPRRRAMGSDTIKCLMCLKA
ncbi:hypothetical protein LTR66_011970 [Elasticomyces elasticus]|nr:hypothetical protein LTR66_011970 [Elasticomyces elasticus]